MVIGTNEIFTLYRCGPSSSALGKKDKDLLRLKKDFLNVDESLSVVAIRPGVRPLSTPHIERDNPRGYSTFRDPGVEQFYKDCSRKGKFIWSIKSNEVASVKDGEGHPIFEVSKDYKPDYHVTIFLSKGAENIDQVWDNLAHLPWKKEGTLKNLVPAAQQTTGAGAHAHSTLVTAHPTATISMSRQTTPNAGSKVVTSGGENTKRKFSRSGREIMFIKIAERRRREQKNVF
ncbi:hypothetical protein E4T56_gene18195 [Termitomyces sp. T112]|nr:hypothetical protein E4T56_gene18195 [Termitomyces sp. T112]KNZ72093.1 hypothetical protein J132_04374 [Termitomyces sp. J132]